MKQLSLLDYLHLLFQLRCGQYTIFPHDDTTYALCLGLEPGVDSPVYILPKRRDVNGFAPITNEASLIWKVMNGVEHETARIRRLH